MAINTAVLLSLLLASGALGQTAATTPENPTMTSQRFDRDKETLYAMFSQNKMGPSPEHQNRAYGAAREFVRRYGGDNDVYAKEARQFVTEFEKGIRQDEVYTAYGEKNYAKAFELGRPLLKAEPDNFFVLSVMAEAGYENAQTGNATLNEEIVGYLRSAIQLVEANKVKKADPFKNFDAASGFLNLALGWFLRDKSPVEATTAFAKAVQPKSPYEKDALVYYRLGVAILKGEFAQLSAEYNEKYGGKLASPEQQTIFERIIRQGERASDAFARAVALSNPKPEAADTTNQAQFTPEFRSRVLAQLTALYKSLHNNSDAGLNELIEGVLSKPLP